MSQRCPMASGRPSNVNKREMTTVFDLPPVETQELPSHVHKPSTTVFHRPSLHGRNVRTPRTNVTAHKAHLRLRELTQTNLGPTRTLTNLELDKIALDYLTNRSKSTDSWFHQKQQLVQDRPRVQHEKRTFRNVSTQIATLPPITSNGEPILRRPTILQPKSVSESGDFFKVILKNKELMPFSFQGDLKMSRDFYASHYPLLMRKTFEASPPTSRRVSFVTEEIVREFVRHTSAERRAMKLEEKNAAMEEILKGLEADDEDGEMVTELRHSVFDPLVWSWNQNK